MLQSYYLTARKKIKKIPDIYPIKKTDIFDDIITSSNIENISSEELLQKIIVIFMPIRNDKTIMRIQNPRVLPLDFSTKNPRMIRLSIKSKIRLEKIDWDLIKKYLDNNKIL
jgi:hypothetical protein